MKLSSQELRKIIKEELNNVLETTVFPKDPLDYISDPNIKKKIQDLIDQGEPEMAYELASTLQDKEGGYEGDDYMADFRFSKSKMDSDKLSNLKDQAFKRIPGLKDVFGPMVEGSFFEVIFDSRGPLLYLDFGKTTDSSFQDSLYQSAWQNEKLPDADRSYTPDVKLIGLTNKQSQGAINNMFFDNFLDMLQRKSGVQRSVIENEIMKFIHESIPNYSVKWR